MTFPLSVVSITAMRWALASRMSASRCMSRARSWPDVFRHTVSYARRAAAMASATCAGLACGTEAQASRV
jgi:hypothetical protein